MYDLKNMDIQSSDLGKNVNNNTDQSKVLKSFPENVKFSCYPCPGMNFFFLLLLHFIVCERKAKRL